MAVSYTHLSLNLSDTKDKTAAEKLQGYWILEIGELAGLRKAEVETPVSYTHLDVYKRQAWCQEDWQAT